MEETKEIKIQVPEGYEIDKENSTFERIKLKLIKNVKVWEDLKHIGGYYIDIFSRYCCVARESMIDIEGDKNVFLTEKHAKSALAMSQISQLIPYYGGAITDEEWNNQDMLKFVLYRKNNSIKDDVIWTRYNFIAFHTKEQRDDFLKYNERLVRDYFMLD